MPWPKVLVTRMLTRDLFAVVNLLVTSANDLADLLFGSSNYTVSAVLFCHLAYDNKINAAY